MLYKIAELLCSCCTLTTVQFKKYVNDMKYVTAVAVAVYVRTSYAIVSRHCLKSLPFFFFFFFFPTYIYNYPLTSCITSRLTVLHLVE